MNAMCLADANLNALGDFDAIVAGEHAWSSAAVRDQAARFACALVAMGITPGERVLIWLPNVPQLVIAWRSTIRAGAVAVIAHHESPQRRIEALVAETAPAAIVTTAALAASAPTSVAMVLRFRIGADDGAAPHGWLDVERLVRDSAPLDEPVPRADDDIATIGYTSGTTGAPRGYVTRHGALAVRLCRPPADLVRGTPPVRHLAVLPMSSGFGSGPLTFGLTHACTVHLHDRFEPERVLDAIACNRIERTSLVPSMGEALLAVAQRTRHDVSSLREVVVGGAHVPAALMDRFARTFGVRLTVQYGLSGVGFVSRSTPSSPAGSSGRLIPALQAKVVDRDGRALDAGVAGALLLRRRDGITGELWGPRTTPLAAADAGAWFRTGDLARIDADGELYILGRIDDIIIQGGHNIRGQEVAAIIAELPAVRECAVVGVPDEFLGQEAVACVSLHETSLAPRQRGEGRGEGRGQHQNIAHSDAPPHLTSTEILTHCRTHLDPRGIPAAVLFLDALPRTESGKVSHEALRAAIEAARATIRETSLVRRLSLARPDERLPLLREALRGMLAKLEAAPRQDAPTSDTSFVDLGLDSLGTVEFAEAISEAIGRRVPPPLAYRHPSIDAMSEFLLDLLALRPQADARLAHTPDPPPPDAAPLLLDGVLSAAEIARARTALSLPRDIRTVFLTGANGYLGRFLVEEICEQLPAAGRLHCLVRAPSDALAFLRLRSSYASDPALVARFDRLVAGGGIRVLAGDFTQPRFGLPEAAYANLCGEVDAIVHNGAVVNHLLDYRDLYAPNVLGTAEIARFAVAQRTKAVHYVSSAAVLNGARRSAGYARSKQTSENLLRELHERLGVPVHIHRPSWVMAHTRYAGQINASDTLTRLLQGIVATSIAPRSFYQEGRAAGAYYDGLPVEIVARAIASRATARIEPAAYREHDIANPHRDVSLDVIVDWVRSAGYRVDRIDDYAAWHRLFKDRLGALDRTARRPSLLPLLHQWDRPRRGRRSGDDALVRAFATPAKPARGEPHAPLPRITEAFVHKALADMRALGLIHEPMDARQLAV